MRRRGAALGRIAPLVALAIGCGDPEPPPAPPMAALAACPAVQPPVIEAGEPLAMLDLVACVGAPRSDGSSIVRIGASSLGSGFDGRLDAGELERAVAGARGRRVTIVADAASAATTVAQVFVAAAGAGASAVELGSRGPEGLRTRDLVGPPPIPYPDVAEEPATDPIRKFLHLERDGIAWATTFGDVGDATIARDLAALRTFVDERRVVDPHSLPPLTLGWIAGTTYADLLSVIDVALERFGVVLDPDMGGPERWSTATTEELFAAMRAPVPSRAEILSLLTSPSYATLTDPAGAPTLTLGESDVRGALSSHVVARVIRHHDAEILACYEAALDAHPTLAGRVTIAFIVAPSGAVTSANVQSTTMNEPSVEHCLTAAVRTWTFPEPDGGGVAGVNVPFAFDRVATP